MPRKAPTKKQIASMQRGRELSRAVDAYLKAINRPKRRGRQLTPQQIAERLKDAREDAAAATGVAKLQALQDIKDLEARRAELEDQTPSKAELRKLEADFVKAAAEYGESKGIEYKTWREAGVPVSVLKKAGIS